MLLLGVYFFKISTRICTLTESPEAKFVDVIEANYIRKPRRKCMFMNSASIEKYISYTVLSIYSIFIWGGGEGRWVRE
jgi:hypothetical protein